MDWSWLIYLSAVSVVVAILTYLTSMVYVYGMSQGALVRTLGSGKKVPVGLGAIIPLIFMIVGPAQFIVALKAQTVWIGWMPASIFLAITLSAGMIGLLSDALDAAQNEEFEKLWKKLVRLAGWLLIALSGMLMQTTNVGLIALNCAIIVLFMNLMRQLNTKPGRVIKSSLAVIAIVVGITIIMHYMPMRTVLREETVFLFFPLVLMLFALMPFDFGGKALIGNAGANVLGALMGLLVVWELKIRFQWVTLIILIILTIIPGYVSYSKIIDAIPPLRWLDRMGVCEE